MNTFTTVPLSEFFGLFAPKFLIGTTYTASLAFFESVVLPKVDRSRLNGAVIVGDEFGFANATTEASALVDVTTTYSMVLAPHGKSFHAKVWIMATDDEFAVLCGSGNLTHSGFIGNHELFDVLRFRRKGDERELAEEIIQFVEALADLFKAFDGDTVPARNILLDCTEVMRGVAKTQQSSAARRLFFLSSFFGDFPRQIAARVGPGISKVRVAAPFFGGGYKGIDLLKAQFPSAKLEVFPALHGAAIDLPQTSAGEVRSKLKLWTEKKSFGHLKLYGFTGSDGAWLFNGSVNCTEQALSGANVEAGILRKVPKSTADFYFEPDGPLPDAEELKIVWPSSEIHWLRIWAVNLGSGIRLTLDPTNSPSIPLTDVSVELLTGSQSCVGQFPQGFLKPVWSLPWGHFSKRLEGKNCLTVKVSGTDSRGRSYQGVAFVDDTSALTSSPLQRLARAGVQAILTSEAMPTLAELGAVFELVGHVLDATEDEPVPDDDGSASKKKSSESSPRAEPIWPPRTGAGRGAGLGWGSGNDGWFQKMLEGLLHDPNLGEVADDESADLDAGQRPAQPGERKKKIAQKVFDLARERIDGFARKMHSMTPDQVRASRIMPVAVGYFHLAQRAWKSTRSLRGEASEKELIELAAVYAKVLFDRRPQGHTYTPAFGSVYRHQMFPPLAWDIHHRYKIAIHASLVPFHVALFAFLKMGEGGRFSRRQWLTFRSAAELRAVDVAMKSAALEAAQRLFSTDEKSGEFAAKLNAAVDALDQIDWRTEPAYGELQIAWQRKRKIIVVDPHQRFCPNDGCPRIISPEFDGLSAIGIVECPRCRSVLAPFQLHEAFSVDHAN